jgi:2'-5' RNA ligase
MLEFKNWVLNESYSYSCVMATINYDHIVNWSKKNISEKDLYYKENKSGYELDPHVTVLYGLHTTNVDEIKEKLNDQKKFEIKLGKISKFTNDDYDVLKIEVESDTLRKLNDKLKKLKYTSTYNSYKPHCTLAYVKKDTCENLIGSKEFFNKKIEVKELVFSPSTGETVKIKLT